MRKTSVWAIVWLLAMLPATIAAQTTGGTLAGMVFDDSKAALPGVTVTIRQLETASQRVVTTDGEGRYQAESLQPGTYAITVELAGFQTNVRDGIRLNLGQRAVVNFSLNIGGVEERITVTGDASLVNTTQGGLSGVVEQQQIRDLPLNGRDFSQLTLLQPGVLATPTVEKSIDRGMGTQVAIAGARPNQISFLLDGTDVNSQGNQSPGSAAGGMLGVESVREFQVLINSYSAEHGRSSGGIVSAVTRSGTNNIHGAAFEFHRNDKLDAKTYFDPEDEAKPPFTRNQFGGYLGGPIRPDRTFFFGSYEGLRQDLTQTSIVRVPSRATRARTDISPLVAPYLSFYPLPNGVETGATGLFTHSLEQPIREHYFVTKIDHRLSDSDSLSLRYVYGDATQTTPGSLGLWENQQHTNNQFATLHYQRVVSSRLLNEFRVAFNRPFEESVNVMNFEDNPALYFIPGTRIGNISVSGITGLGPDSETPTFFDYRNWQWMNTLTYNRGAHTFKAGVNWTRWINDQDASFQYGGNFAFTSLADFLQGRPNTFEGATPGSTTDRKWTQNLVGLFVQDDWAAADRLTLNLGLRYEFFTEPKEGQDRVAHMKTVMDPTTTLGYPLFKNPSLKNIAPRLGFGWDVFGDGRTSLRGGGGYFYEPILGNYYRTYGNRTPPRMEQANISRPPFPNPLGGNFVVRNRLDLFEFEPTTPLRLQYNLTLQRELVAGTVLSVGYIGSRGFNQVRNVEANHSVPEILPDGRYFFPLVDGRTPPRRNPNFESIRIRLTDGNSWYNGLATSLSKRFSSGLQFQGSYTFGKSTDEGTQAIGSSDFGNSFQPRYAYDRSDNYGRSDFDIRHNFVANYSYELPQAENLGRVASLLVNGWQISGIFSARSGVPFTPVLGFDRARARPRSGGAGQRPSWAHGYDRDDVVKGGPTQYFDPNAFVLPEAGFFGDVGRNVLEGPGYATWDMSVMKNFVAGQRRLQLRFEVFNLLNRANFGVPARTVFNSQGRVENAGEITDIVGSARQMQIGLKFEF